ncbi:hypothetical protein GW17_00057660 [Ensete ventricosum]|nr:hypothetical protein GW17_00057660 [Ensete ventricosum]RZR94667.1 hypothetical protein BHM03_00023420 [Ensete ventricosum]
MGAPRRRAKQRTHPRFYAPGGDGSDVHGFWLQQRGGKGWRRKPHHNSRTKFGEIFVFREDPSKKVFLILRVNLTYGYLKTSRRRVHDLCLFDVAQLCRHFVAKGKCDTGLRVLFLLAVGPARMGW